MFSKSLKKWNKLIYLVFNVRLLIPVQMNFDNLRSIKLNSGTFADDLYRIHKILQQGIIYRSQRSASINVIALDLSNLQTNNINMFLPCLIPPRTLLLVLSTSFPRWLRKNLAFANKHYMFARKLFLQFSYQPRLDLLERFQFWHGHIYDDRL